MARHCNIALMGLESQGYREHWRRDFCLCADGSILLHPILADISKAMTEILRLGIILFLVIYGTIMKMMEVIHDSTLYRKRTEYSNSAHQPKIPEAEPEDDRNQRMRLFSERCESRDHVAGGRAMSVIEEISKYLIENPGKMVIFSGDKSINALRFEIREMKESSQQYVDSKYISIRDLLDIGDPDNVIRFYFDQMIKEMENHG